jgi:Protein of unknown function (DUF3060)
MMGTGNAVVADTVVHDITVYGWWDETVYFKNGQPLMDRGRELSMVNRINHVGS